MMISLFILLTTIFSIARSDYSFVSIGDWGGAQLGGQYTINVDTVAAQMATTATNVNAQFVIGVGDNFYWCGIQNTSDPQITNDFLIPYNYPSLKVRWYNALGNHEYGYNVTAQVDYTQISSNWYMPARYYTHRIPLPSSGNQYLTLLFLDTSPCISDYRSSNPNLWDPCMTQYPTCSQTNSANDDFEGPCLFNSNILSQDCSTQYNWLKTTLQGIPTTDWLLIIGHHPIDEVDVKDMTTLIQQRGFSLYLNGHTHTLNQYTIDGTGAYITTGAGSMVNTYDQENPLTQAKSEGKEITMEVLKASGKLQSSSPSYDESHPTKEGSGHSYQTVWNKKVAGFTQHSFNSDYSQLTTNFIDYLGNIVHSFTVNKQGKIIS